jgi:alcohol dehydrogenase (NADP+)
MLCGGVTVYNPLVTNGAGPGVDVGVVGIGGLGHFALLFAKALGANVTAISHSERKKEDALALGASKFIATHSGGQQDFAPHARTLDLIICTTNDPEVGPPLAETNASEKSLKQPHCIDALVRIPVFAEA